MKRQAGDRIVPISLPALDGSTFNPRHASGHSEDLMAVWRSAT